MKKIVLLSTMLILTACSNEPIAQPIQSPITEEKSLSVEKEVVQATEKSKPSTSPGTSEISKISEKPTTVTQVLQKATYLIGKVISQKELADEYCQNSGYGLLPDQNALDNLSGQVKDFLIANKDNENINDLFSVCKKGENIYVLFTSRDGSYSVSLWENKSNFKFFKDENGSVEYFGGDGTVTSFITDGEGENTLIYSVSKDIPYVIWRIYILDPKIVQSRLAEKCKLEFEYDSKTSTMNIDKSTLTCDKEYKP